MAHPDRIEGLAIVSADGMIADAHGIQPDALKLEADQRFFHAKLDEATALAHGRNSSEGGPHMARRRRLILTRTIAGLARDPQNDKALHWNPAGASLEQAWEALGLSGGSLHVTKLPGGRPVFPGIPPHGPEDLLEQHGLKPGATQVLDQAAGLTLVSWRR